MKDDKIIWLNDLKQTLTCPGYTPATQENLNEFSKKLKNVKTFDDFLNLQKEIVDAKNITFCTNIFEKICVLNSFSVLLKNENENTCGIEYAKNSKNPDNVIRYYIYDDVSDRIRSRMANVEMLKKSLHIVSHEWSFYKNYVNAMYANLLKKKDDINNAKYKKSVEKRIEHNIEVFQKLLS